MRRGTPPTARRGSPTGAAMSSGASMLTSASTATAGTSATSDADRRMGRRPLFHDDVDGRMY